MPRLLAAPTRGHRSGWGAQGDNKTLQAAEFQQKASALPRGLFSMYWELDPAAHRRLVRRDAARAGADGWEGAGGVADGALLGDAGRGTAALAGPLAGGLGLRAFGPQLEAQPRLRDERAVVDGACVCAPGWRGPRCSAQARADAAASAATTQARPGWLDREGHIVAHVQQLHPW